MYNSQMFTLFDYWEAEPHRMHGEGKWVLSIGGSLVAEIEQFPSPNRFSVRAPGIMRECAAMDEAFAIAEVNVVRFVRETAGMVGNALTEIGGGV